MKTYLHYSPYVHFGQHFRRKQEGYNQIEDECDIHQVDADSKHFWRVQTDRHQTDKSTESKQSPYPEFIDPINVRIVIQVLVWAEVRQRMTIFKTSFSIYQHFGKSRNESGLHLCISFLSYQLQKL